MSSGLAATRSADGLCSRGDRPSASLPVLQGRGPRSVARAVNILVRVEHLVKHFTVRSRGPRHQRHAVVHAVDDVSFDLARGETLGLVGESGSGKSTVARCVARLYDLTSGQVIFDGHDISTLSRRQLRPYRPRMQLVFQDPYGSFNPRRRIGATIAEPLVVHGSPTAPPCGNGSTSSWRS